MRKVALVAVLMAATLTGCGGGDDQNDAFAGTGSTGGGTGTGGTAATAPQLGSGTGAGFQAGIIGLSNAAVSAGGSTSLSVSLVQSDGSLYTTGTTPTSITFNSPCIAAGTASITPSATASTATGAATVTYLAKGCAGSDVVTATATVAGVVRSATGTVTVAAAAIGSIAFISATPNNIALKGTGDASRPESSTVVFRVLDAAGGPRSGATVGFTLNTAVGGITLTPAAATATSDALGNAQIVVNAGTVATSVKVTATITSVTPNISTQSNQLTITSGIPTAGSFSLAVGCFNVEAWDNDGITTPLTARLADRFNNPVPDGTAVTFTAEGGTVQAQCPTATTATEGGVCTVNWRSSNPRPGDGRVSILAKAIGEESFNDTNGNGAFDNGETFTDLAEPFRDDNEDGAYNSANDNDFFDFNNNGVRNVADALFNGVLCNDTAGRCGNASTRSTGIGKQALIIMSGNSAAISVEPSAPIVIPAGTAQLVTFWIRDQVHGNPMPGGSDVTVATGGAGGLGIAGAATTKVPCSAIPAGQKGGGTLFGFLVTAGTTPGIGFISVNVKTPLGIVTAAAFSIQVQ